MRQFAGVVITNQQNQILLVREKKPSVLGKYNLPGGRIEEGETPAACASREALEETGLHVQAAKVLGVYKFAAGEQMIFVAVHTQSSVPADGELECAWLSVAEAQMLPDTAVLNPDKFHAILNDLKNS